jgi:pilus assembly protein CpaB
MNKRLIPVLIFALIISGAATFVVYRLVAAKMAAAAKPVQNQVVVAAHDLQIGLLVKDEDLRMTDWAGPIPKGATVKIEDAVNRGVLTMIYEGEPVLDSRLAAKGAGGGLAATIPVGKRAVALRVNDVVGVAGFVVPGMRVDVLISGTPPSGNGSVGTLSRTVLQNIEVLSAGQKIEKSADGKPESVSVVNVLVTPEQAEVLTLASMQTQIQLVLRNPLDTQEAKTPGTATASLFSGAPVPKPAAPVAVRHVAPRPPAPVQAAVPKEKVVIPITVEIFHGGKRAQTEFKPVTQENE